MPRKKKRNWDDWEYYADGKLIATVPKGLDAMDAMEIARAKSRTYRGELVEVFRLGRRIIVAQDGTMLAQHDAPTRVKENPPRHIGGYPDSGGRLMDFRGHRTPWYIDTTVREYRVHDGMSDKAYAVILRRIGNSKQVAVGLSYGTGMILRGSVIANAAYTELKGEAIAEAEYWLAKDQEDDAESAEQEAREGYDSNPHPMLTKEHWGDDEGYGWIITHDHEYERSEKEGTLLDWEKKEVGIIGPRSVPDSIVKQLKAGKGVAFRMYDDDGNLYYSGKYIGPDDESMFGPLEDFGTPNAGATEIRYRNKETGKWETL